MKILPILFLFLIFTYQLESQPLLIPYSGPFDARATTFSNEYYSIVSQQLSENAFSQNYFPIITMFSMVSDPNAFFDTHRKKVEVPEWGIIIAVKRKSSECMLISMKADKNILNQILISDKRKQHFNPKTVKVIVNKMQLDSTLTETIRKLFYSMVSNVKYSDQSYGSIDGSDIYYNFSINGKYGVRSGYNFHIVFDSPCWYMNRICDILSSISVTKGEEQQTYYKKLNIEISELQKKIGAN